MGLQLTRTVNGADDCYQRGKEIARRISQRLRVPNSISIKNLQK